MLQYKHNFVELVQLMEGEYNTDKYTLGPLTIYKRDDDFIVEVQDEQLGMGRYEVRINKYSDFTLNNPNKPMTFEEALQIKKPVRLICDYGDIEECTEYLMIDEILVDLGQGYYPDELAIIFKHGEWYAK